MGTTTDSSSSSETLGSDEIEDSSVTEWISDSHSNASSATPSTFSSPTGVCEDSSPSFQVGSLEDDEFSIGDSPHCIKDTTTELDNACSTITKDKASCNMPKDVKCEIPSNLCSESSDSQNCEKDLFKDAVNGQHAYIDSRTSEFSTTSNCSKSETYPEDNYIQLDAQSDTSLKICDQRFPAVTSCNRKLHSSSTTMKQATQACDPYSAHSSVKAESLGSSNSKGEAIGQSKNMKSFAFASAKQTSSYGQGPGRPSLSLQERVKVENAPKDPKESYQRTNFAARSLEPSVQRAVQQLKLSKLLKQNKSWYGDVVPRKMKFVFPYDSFVKLYNYDKVEMRPSGLINCGNSCYANVVIQCLAFTPPITAYLLQGLHSKTCSTRKWCFTCELEILLIKVRQGQSPLSTSGILSHIHKIGEHLGHGREEDAHEFLRYAIDAMQSACLNEARMSAVDQFAEETNLIQLTFGGYLLSKVKCMKCHHKSEQHERMMDITVEIQGDIGTLEEALQKFTASEILDGENKYLCDGCNSYERARKKLTIFEAPNILPVVLKRFQSGRFGKISKYVSYPQSLDLTPYLSGPNNRSAVYRLYAVVVHLDVMNATFSGHYVCYVRSAHGQWYKTDDSTIKAIDVDRVLSKNAYMLFYARCSLHAPSLLRSISCSSQATRGTSKIKDVFSSTGDTETARTSFLSSTSKLSSSHSRNINKPSWTKDHFSSFDLSDGRFLLCSDTDSSSDTSSLFDCSDEGSCSTRSTRNSSSTDEYLEYIFSNLDQCNWNSPSRFYSGNDSLSSSLVNLTDSSVGVSDPRSFSGDNIGNHDKAVNMK